MAASYYNSSAHIHTLPHANVHSITRSATQASIVKPCQLYFSRWGSRTPLAFRQPVSLPSPSSTLFFSSSLTRSFVSTGSLSLLLSYTPFPLSLLFFFKLPSRDPRRSSPPPLSTYQLNSKPSAEILHVACCGIHASLMQGCLRSGTHVEPS